MSQMIIILFLKIFLKYQTTSKQLYFYVFSVKTKTCTYNQYEYDVDEKRTEGSCVEW